MKRWALMAITRELLEDVYKLEIDLLKTSQDERDVVCVLFALPEGTVLQDMQWGDATRGKANNECRFLVENPEFPEVPEGEPLPRVQATYKREGGVVQFTGWKFYEDRSPEEIRDGARMIREINASLA